MLTKFHPSPDSGRSAWRSPRHLAKPERSYVSFATSAGRRRAPRPQVNRSWGGLDRTAWPTYSAITLMADASEPRRLMVEQLTRHRVASRTLAEIRDALLPKLISGEIRVKGAERVAVENTPR